MPFGKDLKRPPNKFRNSNNTLRIRDLFYETAKYERGRDNIVYTLSTDDHEEGYPSIHRLYVEAEDPAEYQFANEYFDSWRHWDRIRSSKWFQPYYERMKKELTARLESKYVRLMMEKALGDGRDALAAQKYLIDKGYIAEPREKPSAKVGRPKKEPPKPLTMDDQIQADWERMQELMTDEPNTKQERPN